MSKISVVDEAYIKIPIEIHRRFFKAEKWYNNIYEEVDIRNELKDLRDHCKDHRSLDGYHIDMIVEKKNYCTECQREWENGYKNEQGQECCSYCEKV